MDDLSTSWPHWKFGLKGDDLFTKLHDEYNTFPSAIQDPEAFHHDVYELSTACSTADDFYRRMADRKSQRLQELNSSLESASLEIIANPSLIGTEQWQYAIQLFRTKSLDSLVRYFSSYLPEAHAWNREHSPLGGVLSKFGAGRGASITSANTSITDEYSVLDSYCPSLFEDDAEDEHLFSREPECMTSSSSMLSTSSSSSQEEESRPMRTMTLRSNASTVSSSTNTDAESRGDLVFDYDTPARRNSFSDSESEVDAHHDAHQQRFATLKALMPMLHHDDEATSQSEGPETPVSSLSDEDDADVQTEEFAHPHPHIVDNLAHDAEFRPLSHTSSTTTMSSETPTPKAEHRSSCGPINPFDAYSSPLRHRTASSSSLRRTHPHQPTSVPPHHRYRHHRPACRHPHPAASRARTRLAGFTESVDDDDDGDVEVDESVLRRLTRRGAVRGHAGRAQTAVALERSCSQTRLRMRRG